jgi:hypothetical protein
VCPVITTFGVDGRNVLHVSEPIGTLKAFPTTNVQAEDQVSWSRSALTQRAHERLAVEAAGASPAQDELKIISDGFAEYDLIVAAGQF